MKLSNDPKVKLFRVQGALWSSLLQNPYLLECLQNEYESVKAWYPLDINGS